MRAKHNTTFGALRWLGLSGLALMTLTSCLSEAPEGIGESLPAQTTVRMDFFARPLPEIPLPNDLATRFDPSSATGRRINASMITPSKFESRVRELVDQMDGWGTMQQISIPFTGPLDIQSIVDGHRDTDYDPSNDVVYLIDIDPTSKEFGKLFPVDVGEGNYPVVLERIEYWKNDPRNWTLALLVEEGNEDRDGDGEMDLGGDLNGNNIIDSPEEFPEDTDADGVLDGGNYLPGATPALDDLAARADALMTFYERETNTLLMRPVAPLRERTTYAVVVTRRLLDADGRPVGSPYPWPHHSAQTMALHKLPEVLPEGTTMSDVAFAFTFTTQSIESSWIAVRDGLYGHGIQKHLGEEYPADLEQLLEVRVDEKFFSDVANPYVMYTENWFDTYKLLVAQVVGQDLNSLEGKLLLDSQKYVDYAVIGSYVSPQLFPREDPAAPGKWIGYNDQKWPEDLDRVKAEARPESVFFWLFMPRKEISARKDGGHVPVVFLGHGYTGARWDTVTLAGHFAKFGIATIGIDNVSHGIGLSEEELEQIYPIMDVFGMRQLMEAILTDRATDQNADGVKDSGADFWSTYLFHTRDVVRQSALDYMQLIRIVKSFDGVRTWDLDVNRDGKPDLAGDFDGDGVVDIGVDSIITMTGGSLGGMMSTYTGSLEPHIDAIAPIAGGGVLTTLGARSQQGGVREAFILRVMCPLYTGTWNKDTGMSVIETIIPDLNDTAEKTIAEVGGLVPGDTVILENLDNGERECANVAPDGTWRVGIKSDMGHRHRLIFYEGPVLAGDPECSLREGASGIEKLIIDTFEAEVTFQGETFEKGKPLVALAEGFGLRRGTPAMRRLFGLGQLIADSADMAVVATHLMDEPLTYPGTGEQTGTHAMIVTTGGDMNVPVDGGMAMARAAGVLEFLKPDDRYGVPLNQVLLNTYQAEAAHTIGRYFDSAGNPVHIDVENFSQGTDPWGADIPRLDPPLHNWYEDKLCDAQGCGVSGAIFPFPQPQGQHGFAFPGGLLDKGRSMCRQACVPDPTVVDPPADPCGCETLQGFDIGSFMFNVLGRYLASGGRVWDIDMCNSRNDCPDIPAPPEFRDKATLR